MPSLPTPNSLPPHLSSSLGETPLDTLSLFPHVLVTTHEVEGRREPPYVSRRTGGPGASACSPTTKGASGAPRSSSATHWTAPSFFAASAMGANRCALCSWPRKPSPKPAMTCCDPGSVPLHASAHSHSQQ